MNRIRNRFAFFIWGILMLLPTGAPAQGREEADRTLSPYFFVQSEDAEVDSLPLKSTSAKVEVAGVIADVTVTQVYQNEGKKPLEAIYIFPASTRAAVYGMKMTIGARTLIAQVREREQARREYEQAKEEGRSASLLERQRPNVFQMKVANLLPGDIIQVELRYTELLVPTEGIYEFVYPTVVGPRYSHQPVADAAPSEMWVQNPYLHQGQSPTYSFDIQAHLAAGLPIAEVSCPTHKINIRYGPTSASLALDPSEKGGGNRDFILKYRLAGGEIQSGLLLYQGEKEKFFLLMMQPPKRVTAHQIPPREYLFLVDVSGSMHGFPLEISKQLLKDLLSNLSPRDRFNVLLFAGGSSLLSERSLPANPQNIRRGIRLIESQQGGGGTELLPALRRALALPKGEGVSRTLVIATDGYVTVEEETLDLIRNHLGDANLFAFGIGTAVNRYLIEGMAHVGMGEPFLITQPEGAQAQADRFRKMIQSPVLTNIRLDFGDFQAYEVEPPSVPDVLAERPVILFGKWRGRPQGQVILRGATATGAYLEKIDLDRVRPLPSHSALRYLWARHRIALLSDYNHLRQDEARVKEVAQLGLTYNLLTAYTSFVAIDTQIRLVDGKPVTVKQPLPLPEGISDYAVGDGSGKGGGMRAKAMSMAIRPSAAPWGSLSADLSLAKEEKNLQDKPQQNAPAPIHLRLGELKVTGGISEDEIRRRIEKELSSLQLCFQRGSKGGLHPTGGVALQFSIDGTGRIRQVSLSQSELKRQEIEECLLRKIRQLQFPTPQDHRPTSVSLTLLLLQSPGLGQERQ